MAQQTNIAWCDSTFSPWHGCEQVSPACHNCYAEQMAKRNPGTLGVWGPDGTRVVASEKKWKSVETWNTNAAQRAAFRAGDPTFDAPRPRVFCASIADVFEDWRGKMITAKGLPFWWCGGSLSDSSMRVDGDGVLRYATMQDIRERLFQLIEDTPNLDWLLLTKRPQNVLRMVPEHWRTKFPDNVWMGATTENQEWYDKRIPELLKIPAVVRFVSIEPLLGEINLGAYGGLGTWHNSCSCGSAIAATYFEPQLIPCKKCGRRTKSVYERGISWSIIGGESGGQNRREFNIGDAVSIVRQCKEADVAVFVKQMGSVPVEYKSPGPGLFGLPEAPDRFPLPMTDKLKGGKFEEFPPELQVREFPTHHLAVPATKGK